MFMIQWTKRGHEIFYDLFPVAFKVFSSFSLNWEENAWSRVGGAGDYRWEWPRDVWVVEKLITSILTDRTKARFTEKVLDVHGVDLSTTTLPKNSTRVTNLIYNKTRLANWSNIIHYIKKGCFDTMMRRAKFLHRSVRNTGHRDICKCQFVFCWNFWKFTVWPFYRNKMTTCNFSIKILVNFNYCSAQKNMNRRWRRWGEKYHFVRYFKILILISKFSIYKFIYCFLSEMQLQNILSKFLNILFFSMVYWNRIWNEIHNYACKFTGLNEFITSSLTITYFTINLLVSARW